MCNTQYCVLCVNINYRLYVWVGLNTILQWLDKNSIYSQRNTFEANNYMSAGTSSMHCFFQHLLASHTIAPLKVLCSKFGPASLLRCSLWILPDVYRFLSTRQHSDCLPSWLRAQCAQMSKSNSFSTLFYQITHTLVFAESQSTERTVCLSSCVRSYAHTYRASTALGSAAGCGG